MNTDRQHQMKLHGIEKPLPDVESQKVHPAQMPQPRGTSELGLSHRIKPGWHGDPLRRLASGDRQRSLGAYFTSGDAAQLMAAEVLRGGVQSVLEPSAGDGVFISALADVATKRGLADVMVTAVELDSKTYETHLTNFPEGIEGRGLCTDFLSTQPELHDAVIGNPPYIRLRNLPTSEREQALRVASECLGHSMDPSGSIWMPFVLHACQSLRDGGRMALVLPYEFTYVRYAKPLWEFLSQNFGDLRVTRTFERMFPDILQDVVLLFAEDKGRSTSTVTYEVFESVSDLVSNSNATISKLEVHDILLDRPFVSSLLPEEVLTALYKIEEITGPVSDYARFSIGYVCGDKEFFHPTRATIDKFNIRSKNLQTAVKGTRQLRGKGLFTSTLPEDATTQLFFPSVDELNSGEIQYVGEGMRAGIHHRYKCRTRDPWYLVPYVQTPDLILSVFSDTPVLLANDGHLAASNSLLCGTLNNGVTTQDFVRSWYSSLTLLSIEMNVHALGGGVFVFVPRETGRIRIATPHISKSVDLSEIHNHLQSSNPQTAYEVGDTSLRSAGVLQDIELEAVIEARRILRRWRQRST